MATQTIKHTYKFLRGKEDAITRENPLLEAGEPITVWCNDGITRMKIGDGVHRFDELNWIGQGVSVSEDEIKTYPTHFDFPMPGDDSYLYRATNEVVLYQWNAIDFKYEPFNISDEPGLDDIECINGGCCTDLL